MATYRVQVKTALESRRFEGPENLGLALVAGRIRHGHVVHVQQQELDHRLVPQVALAAIARHLLEELVGAAIEDTRAEHFHHHHHVGVVERRHRRGRE